MHELAEAFTQRPAPRRVTPSDRDTSSCPDADSYGTPSNTFCSRPRPRSPVRPSPSVLAASRAARLLDFERDASDRWTTETEPDGGNGRTESSMMVEMATMVVFWATLVVFVSSVGKFGVGRMRPAVHDGGWAKWHMGDIHHDLEGIWDGARPRL